MNSPSAPAARPDWGPRGEGDLDPTTVPTYPVVSAQISDEESKSIRVNGRMVPVPAGLTPAQAVVDAAAAEARRLPGETPAIRVSVTMSGERYCLVVTADKQVIPLDQPERSRPRWLIPLLTTAVASLVIVAAAVVLVVNRQHQPPEVVVTPTSTALAPVGVGANLPVPAPPHFAEQAAWSVQVDRSIPPVVAERERLILAVTENHRLVLLDPLSGQAYWQGRHLPSGVSAIHLTHIDGRLVAATATTTQLTYWPLPSQPARATTAGPAESDAVTVDLPQQGTVVWAPTSPLIQLPDQTAGIIQGDRVVTLDIPVGAQAMDADRTSVLALDTAGHWWRVQPGQPFPPAGTLPKPKAGVGAIMRSVAVDTDHVLVVWPTAKASVVAGFVELSTGRLTMEMPLAPATDTATPLATPINAATGARTALGAVLADATTGQLRYLGGSLRTQVITGTHVYALDPHQNVVDVRVDLPTSPPVNTNSTSTAVPDGVLGSGNGQMAMVTADKVDQHLLYALPAV
jgi:hypothetical protein